MSQWSVLIRAPVLGFGVGAVAGGFEAVTLAATLPLLLGFADALALCVCAVGLGGLLGAGLGVPAGVVVRIVGRRLLPPARFAASMAVVAALLGWFYLQPAAMEMLAQSRAAAAVSFGLMPLGIAGVTWFNTHYWLRREDVGDERRFGWLAGSALVGLLLATGSAASLSLETYGSSKAIDSDPNVILLTVDTLRRDHVSAYGGALVQTPHIDALAARGLRFADAITPLPETGPAHAAMFTGRHPLRNEVLSNGHSLTRGWTTLAERLRDEGYATGAFVSSFALDGRLGLDQGFEVYDDDFFPWVRGFSQLLLVRQTLRVVMRFGDPLQFAWLLERPAPQTYDHALDFARRNSDRPWFVWAHVFEPHSPYEPHGMPGFEDNGTPGAPSVDHRHILANEDSFTYTDDVRAKLRRLYAEEVAYTDAQIGRLLDGLATLPGDRPVLLILTADHGEMLGEHGIEFNHHGIWDEALRVPLVVVPLSWRGRDDRKVVPEQVRLMDVHATVLGQLKLDPDENSEGVDLVSMAELPNQRGLGSLLMGRRTASLSQGTLYGYRTDDRERGTGVKYLVDPDAGTEALYDLGVDPGETTDLSAAQPEATARLRQRVEQETAQRFAVGGGGAAGAGAAPTQKAADKLDSQTRKQLEALGYVE